MANPVVIDCPADQWTKIATGITTGTVHKLLKDPNIYLQTYRKTGDSAPTDIQDALPIFVDGLNADISNTLAIDVYIYPVNVAGKVRVDI